MIVMGIEGFTQRQFQAALSEIAKKLLVNPTLEPSKGKRRAYLLGGQSGAGKTTLHKILYDELDHNVIVVNGDEYRRAHPNFQAIQQCYGDDAPAHTALPSFCFPLKARPRPARFSPPRCSVPGPTKSATISNTCSKS